MASPRAPRGLGAIVFLGLMGLFLAAPLGALLTRSLTDDDGVFTLVHYARYLRTPGLRSAIFGTLAIGAGVGLALGRGQSLADALSGKLSVVEGVASAPAVRALARKLGVDMPICEATAALLAGEIQPRDAVSGLLSRPLRPES